MTLERCPVCRARLHGMSTCPRCGAGLDHVLRIAARAEAAERAAMAHLAAGRTERASAWIVEACRLRRTPSCAALARVVADRTREREPPDAHP